MKRQVKIFCSILMVMVIIVGEVHALAQTYIADGFGKTWKTTGEYVSSGIYRYYLCKASSKGSVVDCIPTDIILCQYHKKGTPATVNLSKAETTEVSYSTTQEFNKSIGADYGISKVITASAEHGYGTTKGWSITKSVTKSYTLSIGKNAATGYYAVAAGVPCYYMRAHKYNSLTNKSKGYYYYYMPSGTVTIYTIYSSDYQETWKIV